jgi:hypothetical protein
MSGIVRVVLVLGGYAVAITAAVGSVLLQQATTHADPASAGMAAFSDAILFFVILGIFAVPPTLLAAYFLYQHRATSRRTTIA